MSLLPELWKLIWDKCSGCPLRQVCRLWRDKNITKPLHVSNISTVSMLQWAVENGYQLDSRSCTLAAKYNHLEVLKYLHEKGCEWNEYACTIAAMNGHLEVLKYLHENKCPWDPNVPIPKI